MPDQEADITVDINLSQTADDIFETLAKQFPVCMGSDEFHFFPQARARSFEWSRWDDFTPDGIDNIIARLNRWDHQLGDYRSLSLSLAQVMDADMLQRVVRTLSDQLARVRVHQTQPTFYLTVIGIGLAQAVETGSKALIARLQYLPGFIDQARHNLDGVPRLFRDLGVDMLAKQRTWLNSLPLTNGCRTPIDDAYHRLDHYLQQARAGEDFLPPVALYEQIARHHMGCLLDPDEIARQLELELVETRAILEGSTASIAPGRSWQAVVDELPRPPMPAGGTAKCYQTAIAELARHCTAIGLIDTDLARACPVTVEPIPGYMRPVRSNAAYSMPPQHPPRGGTFFILEAGPGKDQGIPPDYRLLAAHETFPGHHLLDTCRWRHERPVRRHIEFPIFYEGWASFAEELLFNTGFFHTPADRMLMAKRRFWRALRGQVDFEIHMRRRTLDDATALLVSAGMSPKRAQAMVRRYSLKPGYQLSYTIGRRRFRRLYETFYQHEADPVAFAIRVLAQGEIGFNHLEQLLRQGG